MPRYNQYGPRDDTPLIAGDRNWVGVNMRLDPAQLPPGYASEAVNMRFRRGIPETRRGISRLVWTNRPFIEGGITRAGATATFTATQSHGLTTGDTAHIYGCLQNAYNGSFTVTVTGDTTFTYTVSGTPATPATGFPSASTGAVYPWGTLHGAGVFASPTTFVKYFIIAASGNVYYTFANNHPRRIPLPEGVTLDGRVTFTQAFDRLIMFRGDDLPPLQMSSVDAGFENVPMPAGGAGTEPIPNATRAVFFQNRLVIPHGDDEVALSDIGDYTAYVPTLNDFKINQGSADKLVAVVKFNDTTLVCFKEHSIYAVYNVYGDDLESVQQDELTGQFGLVAAESVAHVGRDLWFLSELGVMSVSQTSQNKLQGVVLPVSDPIQPLIDRINWRYASGAVAAYHDNKYYLAVPLDDAQITGPELLPQITRVFTPSTFKITTTPGTQYEWVKGANETSLVNGSQTLAASGRIIAQGTFVTLNHQTPIKALTGSFRKVITGVNTAVLVYDFLNQAWAGYDRIDQFDVKQWMAYEYNGIRRLFAVTSEGHVMLYEDGFQDQILQPYADATVEFLPLAFVMGDTLRVNGGDTVVTALSSAANQWHITGTLSTTRENLFVKQNGSFGYYQFATSDVFSAPNTQPVMMDEGVRFYATNGVVPAAAITLDASNGDWLVFTQVTHAPIPTTFVTRAYVDSGEGEWKEDLWLAADLQTWAPQYTITLLSEGVAEEETLAEDITKNRTEYYRPHTRQPFNTDNSGLDANDPWRKDYRVLMVTPDIAGSDDTSAISFDVDNGGEGIQLARHQEAHEKFRVRLDGRASRVKVVNASGRIRIMALTLNSRGRQTSAGTHA